MPAIETSVAAATAAVDYDLFANVPGAEVKPGQRVTGVALKGSAAAGDTRVRFMAGSDLVAWIYNNGTGAPGRDDIVPCTYQNLTGATQRLYAIVTDAASTNAIFALAVVQ